jgi:hypothetical protein
VTVGLRGGIIGTVLLGGLIAGCTRKDVLEQPPAPAEFAWDRFLDTLQERTALYFLRETDPGNGLVPDRAPSASPSSVAAIGFGLTVYPVAAERGMISRAEAASRTLRTFEFLLGLPQHERAAGAAGYRGFFYHFIDRGRGTRVWNCELSTIDTGLLMAGALFCQSYFSRSTSTEDSIRALADTLYRRVEWDWAYESTQGIWLGWSPEGGFHESAWTGYNEAMILYILALGSPTHPVPPESWVLWTAPYVWAPYKGLEFVSFGPLFGHQYSHCWLDFRGITDGFMRSKGIDYFENSRRATYTHREYGRENPLGYRDYSRDIWGWTACDGPNDTTFEVDGRVRRFGYYQARGVSVDWVNDDGTIAPTAAGGSVAFAPEICVPALKAMRTRYAEKLWREYGFADAFNPTYVTPETGPGGWVGKDYIGIDQGPIAIMIENLRSGFVWNTMKRNPYVLAGLRRAGFSGGWLDTLRTSGH